MLVGMLARMAVSTGEVFGGAISLRLFDRIA
jgi:hypothetical protein